MRIDNEGQRIIRTDYWQTPHAAQGLLYCSINAGAVRLLVPPSVAATLLAEVPREPRPVLQQTERELSIRWDDDPEQPYEIAIDMSQCDRRIHETDLGRVLPLIWYSSRGAAMTEIRRETVEVRVCQSASPT